MSARGFVPSGDLMLEYALPNRGAELTAFTYHESSGKLAGGATPAPDAPSASKAVPTEAGDRSPYVAFALRPTLPRAERETHRAVALVVDASRSMLGESYRRASELAIRLARELDESDRVTVLACDVECRTLPGEPAHAGRHRRRERRTVPRGRRAGRRLRSRRRRSQCARNPRAGAAIELTHARSASSTSATARPPSARSVPERSSAPCCAASTERVRASTTVAVGAESDAATLAAVARGGGGVVLPYSPGRSVAQTAYAVLAATYGQALTNVEVTLPEGFRAVAPRRLDAIPAGGEAMVLARMDNLELAGDVVVRGQIGAKPFERRYPVKLVANDVRGNAFVPRLYAAARIADLEREGTDDAKRSAIALSSRFNVASRYTSLLVLESAAMFKAFGLDNTRFSPLWSGEEEATGVSSERQEQAFGDDLDEGGDGIRRRHRHRTGRRRPWRAVERRARRLRTVRSEKVLCSGNVGRPGRHAARRKERTGRLPCRLRNPPGRQAEREPWIANRRSGTTR